MTCPSLKFVIGLPHDITELYGATAWRGQLILTTDKGVFTLQVDQPDAEWIKVEPSLTSDEQQHKIHIDNYYVGGEKHD